MTSHVLGLLELAAIYLLAGLAVLAFAATTFANLSELVSGCPIT